jgi:hypothetical protein
VADTQTITRSTAKPAEVRSSRQQEGQAALRDELSGSPDVGAIGFASVLQVLQTTEREALNGRSQQNAEWMFEAPRAAEGQADRAGRLDAQSAQKQADLGGAAQDRGSVQSRTAAARELDAATAKQPSETREGSRLGTERLDGADREGRFGGDGSTRASGFGERSSSDSMGRLAVRVEKLTGSGSEREALGSTRQAGGSSSVDTESMNARGSAIGGVSAVGGQASGAGSAAEQVGTLLGGRAVGGSTSAGGVNAARAAGSAASTSAAQASPTSASERAEGDPAGRDRAAGKGRGEGKASGQTSGESARGNGSAGRGPEETQSRVFERLVRTIKLQQGTQRSSARMQLEPPSLGKMAVEVRVKGSAVEVSVRTERIEARELLHERLVQLQGAMERQGLRLERFDISAQYRGDLNSAFDDSSRGGADGWQGSGSWGGSTSSEGGASWQSETWQDGTRGVSGVGTEQWEADLEEESGAAGFTQTEGNPVDAEARLDIRA